MYFHQPPILFYRSSHDDVKLNVDFVVINILEFKQTNPRQHLNRITKGNDVKWITFT